MNVVVPMERDAHAAVQALLPWYARGQLDDDEMRQVQAHVQQCQACRAELDAEQPLQALLSLPLADPGMGDVETGLAKMRQRLKVASADGSARTPRWLGWALGLQGAAIAALLVLLIQPQLEAPPYHGLSAPGPVVSAQALIMFRADASEQRIRETLQSYDASLVGGPTESGAYLLRLGNVQALPRLRAEPIVTLVESLAPGARP